MPLIRLALALGLLIIALNRNNARAVRPLSRAHQTPH